MQLQHFSILALNYQKTQMYKVEYLGKLINYNLWVSQELNS